MRSFISICVFVIFSVRSLGASFINVDGDSLTAGYGLSPTSSNWVGQLTVSYPQATWTNKALSGKRWEAAWNPHVDSADTTTPLSTHSGDPKRTAIVWCGVNDIAGGNSYSATTNLIAGWISTVRAADSGAKLVGITILKFTGMSGPQETMRGQLNTYIKSGVFDYYVDLDTVSNLSDPSNSTYFQGDGVHTTIAGNSEVAAAVISTLLSNNRVYTDYYVRTDGNNSNTGLANTSGAAWLTIQKAANTIVASETVNVAAGTYNEVVTETSSGTSASRINYVASGSVTVGGFVLSGADWIGITGFNLNGSGVGTGTGCIEIESGSTDNYFTNITVTGTVTITSGAAGIRVLQGADRNYFTNVTEINPNGIAFVIAGDYSWIQGYSVVSSNGWDVFHIVGSNHTNAYGTVRVANPGDANPNHCDIWQGFGNDAADVSTNVVMFANKILLGDGYQFGNVTDDQENGNIAFWHWSNNLLVDVSNTLNLYAPDCTFMNNTFIRVGSPNSGFAITVGSSGAGHTDRIMLRNNIFYQCGSVPTSTFQGWYAGDSVSAPTADYNLVVGTGAGTTKNAAAWTTGLGGISGTFETHGINGSDPVFVSSTDFHLQTNSPCINAGTNLNAYFLTDIEGNTRGSLWNMGAYEATGVDVDAPQLVSATIPNAGTTIERHYTELCVFGAGGSGGFTIAMSGGAVTGTYSAGSGTATHIYTLNRTVLNGETGNDSYVQPNNGVEDGSGNDLASYSGFSIDNQSGQNNPTSTNSPSRKIRMNVRKR